jgi:hypothetical protein
MAAVQTRALAPGPDHQLQQHDGLSKLSTSDWVSAPVSSKYDEYFLLYDQIVKVSLTN